EQPAGHQSGSHDQRLGNGGVLNGFFVGFRTVMGKVQPRGVGQLRHMLWHTGHRQPFAEETWFLGALSRANNGDHDPISPTREPKGGVLSHQVAWEALCNTYKRSAIGVNSGGPQPWRSATQRPPWESRGPSR